MRIEIDLNVRVRGSGTYAGFEDVVDAAPTDLQPGDEVEVFESEADLVGRGHVTAIDVERQLVYLSVDWASLRPPAQHTTVVPITYVRRWYNGALQPERDVATSTVGGPTFKNVEAATEVLTHSHEQPLQAV
ncbi:hypothetical protein [Trujillonella humicola]|uniref:hypothetical protein n=1 Tax=Trujillonella humicola TaxID=3383699 RepID=UPI0039067CBE